MAEAIPKRKRYALVTGANKGIGFQICRQLASRGIHVIFTSRNKERGLEAYQRLAQDFGLSDNLDFHQLDVVDSSSIAALVQFIHTKYGRLDILVNNAGLLGIEVEGDVLILAQQVEEDLTSIFSSEKAQTDQVKANGKLVETLKSAEDCTQTNFYGAKRVTEALIPFMKLSDSPRIVNVSSILGNLKLVRNEWAIQMLSNEAYLTEEKVDEVIQEFLKKSKEGSLEASQWPTHFAAYKVSKAALNAYTRIMAKKYPDFCINSWCPGTARTDLTYNLGPLSAAEAAENVVPLALMPDGGPSGSFFYKKEVMHF